MKENELIKKSIEENILNKERIRMAAISSGSSFAQGKKGVGFMNKKIFVTAFVLIFCVVSVTTMMQRPAGVSGAYDNPKDYAQIYSLFSQMGTAPGYFDWFGNKSALERESPENIGATDQSGEKGMADYSDTNLQVAGVQEADVIKTDGKYIYAISAEYLYIVKADKGALTLVSKIKHLSQSKNGTTSFFEMYVVGDKLIALKQTNQYIAYDSLREGGPKDTSTPEPAPIGIMPIYPSDSGTVTAVIFDISDKSNPTKINQLGQKGNYVSSRMVDNDLYLVTNYTVYTGGIEKQDPTTYVPTTTIDGQQEVPVSPDDIYIAPNPDSDSYMTISGIDIQNSGEFVSTKAVLGSASNIYATMDHLYITNYDSVSENGYYKDKTAIVKFGIENGLVKKLATGSVYGTIINQFSMDEYNGSFRIATTQSKYKEISDGDTTGITTDQGGTSNGLFVLDENLKLIGQVKELAKGEQIYSVRFDGDTGYIVTFKQTDPLFAIDLSNPGDPKVLSALKIPGFSEYMQPFGDGLLFGLGKQTNEATSVTGLKLSMFDVSDKTDVTEIAKEVLGGNYTWTEASYNHKSILVSPKRGLIGFASYDSYFVYHYDKAKGFTLLKQLKIGAEVMKVGLSNGTMRGLYIDDVLYVFTGNEVISMEMGTYEKIQTLPLN